MTISGVGTIQNIRIMLFVDAVMGAWLVIVVLIHDTNPKKTFPLSAQLGGKVKQQCACKGLYEIFLTRGGGLGSQPVH
jgi:hypothetical protein